ncbi:MAG: ABC transporter permease [Candidatus Kariarchaeaceae archaeon]|jgi:ABC-type dipeptide/oligopeptide/nickel transport system permease subunit
MGIGYQPQELKALPISEFSPKSFTWLVSVIGFVGYAITGLLLFFSSFILYDAGIRRLFLNWAFAGYISALILLYLSRLLLDRYGVKYIQISKDSITVKSPLARRTTIFKDEIIHVRVIHPNPALSILPLTSPTVLIATYDKIYRYHTARWSDGKGITDTFEDLSEVVHDEFAEYYHRSKTTIYSFLIRMSQDTAGIVGLTIIIVYFFLASWGGFAMLISPIDNGSPYTLFLRNPEFLNGELEGYNYLTSRFHPPNNDFWFGTDFIGRDIFARLVYGTFFTFLIAFTGSLVSIFIVITLGITSAYYGGTWDSIVTRTADALLTFPPFIPLILISTIALPLRLAIQGGYFLAVFTAMSIFTWPLGARLLRSEVNNLLSMDYVIAAKQLGASNSKILFSHVIPKIIPTVMILFTYAFADIVLGTTLLGFIGMDSESTLTWGSDLSKAVNYGDKLKEIWWTVAFPTFWIFFLVFGLHLFSDTVRDTLDPKLRGGEKAVSYEFKEEMDEIRKLSQP